jgi:3'(2'), 5'-bisphosphate nucleotidase
VADYVEAIININTLLSHAFPDDLILSEEDASDLRRSSASTSTTEGGDALGARVVELADDIEALPHSFPSPDSHFDPSVGGGEQTEWGLGRQSGAEALLKAIDRGKHARGRTGRALRTFVPSYLPLLFTSPDLSSCTFFFSLFF